MQISLLSLRYLFVTPGPALLESDSERQLVVLHPKIKIKKSPPIKNSSQSVLVPLITGVIAAVSVALRNERRARGSSP